MNKKYDIANELQKIQSLNKVITSYRRGSYEIMRENGALQRTLDSYHNFYAEIRTSLYDICEKYPKDKKAKKLFNKVTKFFKEWKM